MNIKKTLLILISFIFIVILIGCGKNFKCSALNCKIKSGEEITFFIATDPHHLSKNTYDHGEAFNWFLNSGDGKLLHYSDEIIDAFTLDIENKKPDILIIPGDLTCNGEKESHLEFAEKLNKIRKQGVHVFVIPGNHDIENPWARNYFGKEMIKIESITKDDFVDIYENFGYKDAISRDNYSLSYLAAPAEDVWLLMLDSAKYKRNKVRDAPEMDGEISSKTLEWVVECSNLAKENNAQIIAVMHHSLMDHSEVVNEHYTIENSEEVIETLLKCDIQITLTGHIHLQDIKSHKKDDKKIYDIATSCLISYPNQYGVLKFLPDKGYNYHTNRVDVDYWTWENDIEDRNLTNFIKYSRDFFERRSYDKYYDTLLEISKFSDDEMKAISKTVAMLNLKYFGGFRNQDMHDIFTTEGFKILQNSAPSFIRDYVMSMFNDEKTNNNKLYVPLNKPRSD